MRSDMNGYVCEFQIYTGKIAIVGEKNLGERVIKDLSQTLRIKINISISTITSQVKI